MINISIKLNKNENIDSALRRLKSKMDQEEIMDTIRKKRAFETPKQIKIRKMKKMHKILKQNRISNKK
jgi:small subunit ribosomal protein S21